MRSLHFAFALVGVLICSAWCAAAVPPPRPNIILIIADDMAVDDCTPYGNGKIRTPNLARMAREGLRFDRAFLTCSSCSPSRSSIITGRYPHATGAAELHLPLPKEQITFPEKLRTAGYWTAAAGKWHLGNAVKDRFDLTPDDFDKRARAGRTEYFDQEPPAMDGSGCEHWVTALRARPKDKPFFLWLAAFDPHRDYKPGAVNPPHKAEDVTVPPFLPDTPAVRSDLALYYDEICRLDSYVGKVLDELDRQGIAQNTLVMFITDNGRPFPRCKTTVYDSGVRTPMLARWTGTITPASTSGSVVSSVDLAPTFLALAGAEAGPSFQGVSFATLLNDPKAEVRQEAFSEHNWHDYGAHERSVRTARYRYIRNSFPNLMGTPPADAVRSPTFQEMRQLRGAGKLPPEQMGCFITPRPAEELYDLQSDPHELKNLAADPAHAATLADLRGRLDTWIKQTDDKVPAAPRKDNFDRESGKPTAARGTVNRE
jgi:arylsulfatase A-like enzyme